MIPEERKQKQEQRRREELTVALSKQWTEAYGKAVKDLKAALAKAPLLAWADISPDASPMQHFTEASQNGLGAIRVACWQSRARDCTIECW